MKKITLFIILGLSISVFAGEPDKIFATGFEASYTVGGDISGLDALGESVEIFLNGVSQTTVMSDGTYTSNDVIEAGQLFDVTIDNNNCTVMNGNGVMPNNAVTNADINCPLAFTTVYDIKQGIVTGEVALQNMLVTVCKDNFGYNLQTVPADPDYVGDDYSGIFVFDSSIDCMALQVGDRVDINPATVNVFFDEIQLVDATFAVQSNGNALPAPVLTTTAALSIGTVHPLNAVLVEVQNATVTGLNSPEYELDMVMIVTNRHYTTTPFPEVGESMAYVIGPLQYSFNQNKIAPRSAADLGRDFKLVINEIDYDQPTTDDEEFIEILNLGPGEADLTDLAIMLVTGDGTFVGTGTLYHTEPLASVGQLGAGEYLVFADPDVINALPPGTANLTIPSAIAIQNSGPEGVALVNTVTEDLLDALSYEGSITEAEVGFINPINLVEGIATSAEDEFTDGSLSRIPSGQDTDDASVDWLFTDFSTPGAPNITELPTGQLLINEVDYDQPGTDTTEFIELYNASSSMIDLTTVDLVLVNGGNDAEYNRIALSGNLSPGEFAVIGSTTVAVPMGVLKINFANSSNNIQNGSPDAVVLVDNSNDTLIDALSYEGAITAAVITGFANPVNLVDGTATAATDANDSIRSIIRFTDGQDTGDDSVDFVESANPTPGEVNML